MATSSRPAAILLAAAIAGAATTKAQEALPSVDPPDRIAALARHTADFRKATLSRPLEIAYRTAGPAWNLVQACVAKDTGRVQALKVAFSKEVRRTKTEEKWKQYELMIQAFFLHHAGEFRAYLRDDLLDVALVRENAVYARHQDGADRFDAESATMLLSGSCAAALYSGDELPYTHACVHKSLDRFRDLALDPENDSQSRVVAINAVLQCALVTGRLAEFRNERWRRVFDDLRDLVPPNGAMPHFGEPAWNDVFGDWGAALRVGAVLFDEPTYAYAANKFQASMTADPARLAWALSPAQWGFINYPVIDKIAPTAPPTLSVVQRSYREGRDTVEKVVLRTGHHPRAAFLIVDPASDTPGTSFNARSAPKEFWAGGTLLTPRAHGPAAAHNIFMVTPPSVTFPAKQDATAPSSGSDGLVMECDAQGTAAENAGQDAFAKVVFSKYLAGDSKLTRRLVLTREGILVISDRFEPDQSAMGHGIGPLWNLGPGEQARGENWFAYGAFTHHLPPGYPGSPRAALVWFAPSTGGTTGEKGGTAYHKAIAKEPRHDFLTVVVPFESGADPRDVAATIALEAPARLKVGDVRVHLPDDAWRVAGNGPRGGAQPASPTWRPSQPLPLRTWTDRAGRKIEAQVLSAADGLVEMRRADGTAVRIPFARLSDADQAYLRALRAK